MPIEAQLWVYDPTDLEADGIIEDQGVDVRVDSESSDEVVVHLRQPRLLAHSVASVYLDRSAAIALRDALTEALYFDHES